MTPDGIAVGFLIAGALIAVAAYFGWRQRLTLQLVRGDTQLPRDQRRYLYKQCWRRLFGSSLLLIVAVMLIGALFLDYETAADADHEDARQAARFLVAYVVVMLFIILVILVVAVFDFWAIARFGVEQRKQLVQEHQAMLERELAQHRHRRSDLN